MGSYESETVVWKENYFMDTVNIYEPRGPKYKCTECYEMFNTRLSILTHSKMHLKPFCVVCATYTQNDQEMQNHMKYNHRSMVQVVNSNQDIQPKMEYLEVDMNNQDQVFLMGNKCQTPPKKPKIQQTKRTPFGLSKNNSILNKRVISRFGRCINVKTPRDY